MKEHITAENIVVLIDGGLSVAKQQQMHMHIQTCAKCATLYEEYMLLQGLFKEDIALAEEPSENLKTNFESMLQNAIQQEVLEPTKRKSSLLFPLLRVAAVVVLLIGSFLLGVWYQQGLAKGNMLALQKHNRVLQNTATLSLMDSNSASKRIQGIAATANFNAEDNEIAQALIFRMLYDVNDNVRLVAAKASLHFTANKKVRDALIEALGKEKNAMLQIELIHILVQIKEKRALQTFQHMQQDAAVIPLVKEQIKELLPQVM